MAKTATLNMRMDAETKESAEKILQSLGLSLSTAVNMFCKQVVIHNGLPFSVHQAYGGAPDVSKMSHDDLVDILLEDYKKTNVAGDAQPVNEAFNDIYKTLGIKK